MDNDKKYGGRQHKYKRDDAYKHEISQFEETQNAIPGGRYGCAQFIKICGPKNLQELSLGRIAQMVQKAV